LTSNSHQVPNIFQFLCFTFFNILTKTVLLSFGKRKIVFNEQKLQHRELVLIRESRSCAPCTSWYSSIPYYQI